MAADHCSVTSASPVPRRHCTRHAPSPSDLAGWDTPPFGPPWRNHAPQQLPLQGPASGPGTFCSSPRVIESLTTAPGPSQYQQVHAFMSCRCCKVWYFVLGSCSCNWAGGHSSKLPPPERLEQQRNPSLLHLFICYNFATLHTTSQRYHTSSNSTSVSFFDEPAQLSSALNNIALVTYMTFYFSLFLFRYHIIHLAVLTIDVASSHEHQKTKAGGCAIPCLPTILIPT